MRDYSRRDETYMTKKIKIMHDTTKRDLRRLKLKF